MLYTLNTYEIWKIIQIMSLFSIKKIHLIILVHIPANFNSEKTK